MFREVGVGGFCKRESLQIIYLQRLESLCIYTVLIHTFRQSHSWLEKVSPYEIMFVGGKVLICYKTCVGDYEEIKQAFKRYTT